jgi:ribosomal protein S18 acetylase RimI-like enzyme
VSTKSRYAWSAIITTGQQNVQQKPIRIVEATAEDGALLGEILGSAFTHDPAFNWVIPDRRLYPGFFQLLAERLYLRHSQVYLDAAHRGAAMWLPPGVSSQISPSLRQLWLVLRLMAHSGTGILKRLGEAQQVMDQHHPQQPHYYLHAIGARLENQGQGIGSALLKEVTRLCDQQQMPAYLESSSARNVELYQRHGFEVQAEQAIGKGGPPLFFMWRESQP